MLAPGKSLKKLNLVYPPHCSSTSRSKYLSSVHAEKSHHSLLLFSSHHSLSFHQHHTPSIKETREIYTSIDKQHLQRRSRRAQASHHNSQMLTTTTSSMSIASSSSSSSTSSSSILFSSINHHHHPHRISLVNNLHPRLNSTRKQRFISCELAVKPNVVDSISSSSSKAELDEDELNQSKVGSRVRVKVPLKVYHVPKVPEVDITGMEGNIKQYVGIWKGHRISANLPFKVEFFKEIEGRGPVKVIAHLKEDEFEYIDEKN